MKKIVLALIVMAGLQPYTSIAQSSTTCQASPIIEQHYKNSIAMMAVDYTWENFLPDTARIEVSPELVQTITEKISAILASGHPAADSVFNKYCVKRYDIYDYTSMFIGVQGSSRWSREWINGNINNTGNATIDILATEYGFEVEVFSDDMFVVTTNRVVNLTALQKTLMRVQGVEWIQTNGTMGDGGHMQCTRVAEGYQFRFVYGFGDCPAGCTAAFVWDFTVTDQCQVQHTGSRLYNSEDEPIPNPVNCNISPRAVSSIANPTLTPSVRLYPNPATNTLFIQAATVPSKVNVYTLAGALVLQSKNTGSIELSTLPAGTYVVAVELNNGNTIYHKIQKQ